MLHTKAHVTDSEAEGQAAVITTYQSTQIKFVQFLRVLGFPKAWGVAVHPPYYRQAEERKGFFFLVAQLLNCNTHHLLHSSMSLWS